MYHHYRLELLATFLDGAERENRLLGTPRWTEVDRVDSSLVRARSTTAGGSSRREAFRKGTVTFVTQDENWSYGASDFLRVRPSCTFTCQERLSAWKALQRISQYVAKKRKRF